MEKAYERYWKWARSHWKILAGIAGIILLTLAVFLADQGSTVLPEDGTQSKVRRNDYGEGKKTEELQVEIQDENGKTLQKELLEFELQERAYTTKEAEKVLSVQAEALETKILKDNSSLDDVRSDLDLITKIPDTSIWVNWESDDYSVIEMNGKVHSEDLTEEGQIVELTAVLNYQDTLIRHSFPVQVYPPDLSNPEQATELLQKSLKETDEETKQDLWVNLPESIRGKKLVWTRKKERRWLAVPVLGAVIMGLLVLEKKEKEKKHAEERKRQMMLDYPEIVNKLTLYTGAGMTVRTAWGRIVEEYQKQKKGEGRYAYEEMQKTWYEMNSGVGERRSYERFMERCQVKVYQQLGMMLQQNLQKGNQGMSEILRREAMQAFEERKALAKIQGEEAGTKLLLPMFLMLAIVLVMVIIPAFLSLQI